MTAILTADEFRRIETEWSGWPEVRGDCADVPALIASHRLLAEEVGRLHERLEDNHVFVSGPDGDLVRQEVEPGTIPDGIDCRDTTIHELDKVVADLRAERDALSLQVARLTEALKPFSELGRDAPGPDRRLVRLAGHDVTWADFRKAAEAVESAPALSNPTGGDRE